MLSFLKDAFRGIIVVAFFLGLIGFAILGWNFSEGPLGIILGIVIGFVVQTLFYGVTAAIIDIADTNEEILKALTKQETTLKSISTNTAFNTTSSESVARKNIWVCSKCGNTDGTIVCAHCGK